MGYFLTVFILLIAAAGVGYVAGHGPNRPASATAVTAKPVTPRPPAAPIPANPVTEVPTQSSQ